MPEEVSKKPDVETEETTEPDLAQDDLDAVAGGGGGGSGAHPLGPPPPAP